MTGYHRSIVKFTAFAIAMAMLTVLLYLVFGQYRSGSTAAYSAVFADASRLKAGDSVRVAGVQVGSVEEVSLRADRKVEVQFNADRTVVLTTGTTAAVRYLNLVGDRYVDLADGPGATVLLPPGGQIPVNRTTPALDLDLLLGGLKPVIQGLNPQDVNALTSSLVQVFQGQGGTLASLLSRTSSFSATLADNDQVIEQLIENLNTMLGTLAKDGTQFSSSIDNLEQLITRLSADRDPIGASISSLSKGTASISGLLGQVRPPLAETVDQLNRLAPILDQDKGVLDSQLQKLPMDYKKLQRVGSYGSFIQEYICGISLRVTDLQGRTAVFPWIKQLNGRCAEPDA